MKRVILSCLMSAVCAAAASATWVPETNAVPISSLPGGSLIVGDKEFSDFHLDIIPGPNIMTVQGVQDVATGDYGLRFDGGAWYAVSGQTVSINLGFTVSILPSYNNYRIKDVWMYLTGAGAAGDGAVIAGENVWDSFPHGNNIASLFCYAQSNSNRLSDHKEFAPLDEIYIDTKNITVSGGTNGIAFFSEFFQFYSQTQPVPEPATIALVGLGGAILLRKRRNSKKY